MLALFKRITRTPSDRELAFAELADAKRALLQAHSAKEYAEAMVNYHQQRVERLADYIDTTA